MWTKYIFLFLLTGYSNTIYADYYVGVWKANLTPTALEALTSCIGGYKTFPDSRCGYADIHDPITVRTISIEDHDSTAIFSAIDTIGVGDSLISDIKNRVVAWSRGHITRENVYISATHTHSGPDLQGLWGGVDNNYRARIVRQVAYSIILAWATAKPVDIRVTKTTAEVNNRRGWDTADDSINILNVYQKNSDRRIAILINMSAHPTFLDGGNTAYSSDYVHDVRKIVERKLGGIAIFINGVVGDAEPGEYDENTFEAARKYGRDISKKIINAISKETPVIGDFNVTSVSFTHPVSNPGILYAVQTGLLDLQLNPDLTVTTKFSTFSFGKNVSGIVFPGEALTHLGQQIKKDMGGQYKFFFGLTDGSLGYFIPSNEFFQIPGRTTEEVASLDLFIGDSIKDAILEQLFIDNNHFDSNGEVKDFTRSAIEYKLELENRLQPLFEAY